MTRLDDDELAELIRCNHSGAHSCVPPCPAGLLERLRRLEEAVDYVLSESFDDNIGDGDRWRSVRVRALSALRAALVAGEEGA